MKVIIQNLGIIRYAEFEPAQLTLICGNNNAGKTYVTYALFGFFTLWKQLIAGRVSEDLIERLWKDSHIDLDMHHYTNTIQSILDTACRKYVNLLPRVFATKPERFKDTQFSIQIDKNEINYDLPYHLESGSGTTNMISVNKAENSPIISISLLTDKKEVKLTKEALSKYINFTLTEIIFNQFFPKTYIASTERTGAAIFRKELDFARNRLIAEIGANASGAVKADNTLELVIKSYQDYALPVNANVDFARNLEAITKDKSYLAMEHPEILDAFSDIIGGDYQVKKDGLYYIPQKGRTRLTMQESSSSVRSLLDVGFYLKHVIQNGDFLMIDEPELNLHPSNQRRMARLFAQLVNAGIRVFVTTHSDYLIRELNTLIMLNSNGNPLTNIMDEVHYHNNELLDVSKVRIYIACEDKVILPDSKRCSKCQTLALANIDPVYGIEVTTFDDTIREMNHIQDRILEEIEGDNHD